MRLPAGACATLAASVTALALVLTGCSNTKSAPGRQPHPGTATASAAGGVQQVTIEATDSDRFRPSTIVVHPGKVRVVLANVGKGAPHNWHLDGFPADFVPLASAGEKQVATFTAPSPGTYTFVCTLHIKEGMTGKLVVLPR